MKTRFATLAMAFMAAFVIFGVVGCSQAVVGTWKTDPVPKEGGYLLQATFKGDGKFEATARQDAETTVPMRGTYDYNGFSMTLKQQGKPEQVFGATYFGGKLTMKQGDKKFTMKKQ